MTRHLFLSPDWFRAVQELLDRDGMPDIAAELRDLELNVTVRDEKTGQVAEVSYRGCFFHPEPIEGAALLSTTRDLAYHVMIERNLVLGVRALATGQAKIRGDRRRLMALRKVRSTPSQAAFEQRVREITTL